MRKKYKNVLAILFSLLIFAAGYKVYAIDYPKPYHRIVKNTQFFDEELLYAVMKAESGFSSEAVSRSGAIGLMQIMPQTAEFIARRNDLGEGDLFDPNYNVAVGAAYLNYLFERVHTIDLVLACYNAGEGRVKSWLNDKAYSSDGQTLHTIPFRETEKYLKRVKKNYKNYRIFY